MTDDQLVSRLKQLLVVTLMSPDAFAQVADVMPGDEKDTGRRQRLDDQERLLANIRVMLELHDAAPAFLAPRLPRPASPPHRVG